MINAAAYPGITTELAGKATLVAVSKTKPVTDIQALYDLGQRDFGENYVQELEEKYQQLPKDIHWHFIGHLQSNKVKYIASFVHLIHGVDSFSLLKEINKQAQKNNRTIDCLLQVYIATEETKFGLDETEVKELLTGTEILQLQNVRIKGFMGMASFSDNQKIVEEEFIRLNRLFLAYKAISNDFNILSMGMSGDYNIAIASGSNMVRIGSLLFGERAPK